MTPSSGREAPFDITMQRAREGTEGGKKRRKQRPQLATTTADYDDDNNGKVGGSSTGHVATAMNSDMSQAWLPTNHFKRMLEEACPNHVYPVRHKLKDCDMMNHFMISGSPTWGKELDEDPGGSDTMPFPRENTVMMAFGGRPRQGHATCLS
jgi:hypothetical protein